MKITIEWHGGFVVLPQFVTLTQADGSLKAVKISEGYKVKFPPKIYNVDKDKK